MREAPPTRTITRENATEYRLDREGIMRPYNDGNDIPGVIYQTIYVVGGDPIRIAIGMEPSSDPEPSYDEYWR